MPNQAMTVNPIYNEDLEGNTTYIGSELETIDDRLSAVEEHAYEMDDYRDPYETEAELYEEANGEFDHGDVDEDTQTLLDWAANNYDQDQIEHLNNLLSDADDDLQNAVLQSIFEDMASAGEFEGLDENEEYASEDEEPFDDFGPMTEGEAELFDEVVTDLTGVEPLGEEQSDMLLAAANENSDNPIVRDMLLASAAFHTGDAEVDQIARVLIQEYGKSAVYQTYKELVEAFNSQN